MIKDKPIPNIIARVMFRMHSPKRLQKEIKLIHSGLINIDDKILDFGCGPGHLSVEMAKETGINGVVYALDIHPLALKNTEDLISKSILKNIKTILSDQSETGLGNSTVDIIFIFNTIDMIHSKTRMINEFERVLKPGGLLIIRNKRNSRSKGYYGNLFSNTQIAFIKQENQTFHYQKL